MRNAKYLDRSMLPEIEDFNALGDVRRFRFFASRYMPTTSARRSTSLFKRSMGWCCTAWERSYRPARHVRAPDGVLKAAMGVGNDQLGAFQPSGP